VPVPLQSFRSRIEINGINPYVLIEPKQALRLKRNWRKPMPVRVQINGQPEVPWRINLMPRGDGSFYLYLAGIVRKASGTGVGDVVSVSVAFDAEYKTGPMHPMPRWFGARLNSSPLARAGWRRLPPSRQKEILRYFARLKSPEARARNLDRALFVLAGGQGRFMARDWNVGSDRATARG
jgi:Domain of unknown function (DUF1905)/Bacteriocin-protection, YdeI or OmpD-Associated